MHLNNNIWREKERTRTQWKTYPWKSSFSSKTSRTPSVNSWDVHLPSSFTPCNFLRKSLGIPSTNVVKNSPTPLPPPSQCSLESKTLSVSSFLPKKPQPKAPLSSSLLSLQVQAAQAFLSQNISHRSTADHLSLCSALSKISSSYGLLKAKPLPQKTKQKLLLLKLFCHLPLLGDISFFPRICPSNPLCSHSHQHYYPLHAAGNTLNRKHAPFF